MDHEHPTSGAQKPSPQEWMPYIERGFYERLRALRPSHRLPETLENAVRARVAVRRGGCAHLVRNVLDAANVHFTVLAIALFDEVGPLLGCERAVKLVDDCLNQPLRAPVLDGTRRL